MIILRKDVLLGEIWQSAFQQHQTDCQETVFFRFKL